MPLAGLGGPALIAVIRLELAVSLTIELAGELSYLETEITIQEHAWWSYPFRLKNVLCLSENFKSAISESVPSQHPSRSSR